MQLIFWAIGIVLIILIFTFVRVKYIKHKLSWILLIVLALFIYITFMASIIGKNVDLNTYDGLQSSVKLYFAWLGNAFDNTKVITGNAVKLNWNTNTSKIFG